jgi:hypothetical protein
MVAALGLNHQTVHAHAGAALLATQPGMRRASAGEVAAVLSGGVSMHKAWIHDTKRAATGSTRRAPATPFAALRPHPCRPQLVRPGPVLFHLQ